MHFNINQSNQINSLASDKIDNYLRISAQSTTKSMYTQWNHAVLCTMEPITSPYIAFKGTYDILHDIIDDITDDVIKIEYWKVFPLNTPF